MRINPTTSGSGVSTL
nr:ATP synthase CF1 beta subunit [Lycianthes radiata]UNZ89217.1 ATP synthase CF1 beta subunit [Lycianthes radiata]